MECTCLTGPGNTGQPNCQVLFDVTKKLILVPYYNADGTINGLDVSSISELTEVDVLAKTQNIDSALRWYPTPEIKNIVDERAEDISEEFEDGTSVFIQEGARTFTGIIVGASAAFKGQMDSWRCQKMGYYAIDKSGNLIGDNSRTGYLDPIKIQDNSFSVGYVKTTDTTAPKVSVSFTIDQLMNDANLSMIAASNIEISMLSLNGLIDAIAATPTSVTTAGFTVIMNTPFGGVISRIRALGLELTDFVAYNVTQSSAETLASVTETDGSYAFVYDSAVTASDQIRISNKAAGNLDKGYDITTFTVDTPA